MRRRPTEVERRRTSRPHDGKTLFRLSMRRYRTHRHATGAAHATRQTHAGVDVGPTSARLRTRIAMIVVAHTTAANHRAEDAAKNATGTAAARGPQRPR